MRLARSSFALLLLTGVVVLGTTSSGKAQTVAKPISVEGQLVCSECWFEADRKTTPYGDAADIQCAKDCAVKGLPPAVAVKVGDEFTLYVLEAGQFNQRKDSWLDYVGKSVRVSGRTQRRADRNYLAVDQFELSSLATAGSGWQGAIGA